MKVLHRIKALAAYDGAKLVLKSEMTYPAYMLFKEAARGVLSYMVEDQLNQEISDKTKLSRLLDLVNTEEISEQGVEAIQILIKAEESGLSSILSLEIGQLKKIKHEVKELIIEQLKEPI